MKNYHNKKYILGDQKVYVTPDLSCIISLPKEKYEEPRMKTLIFEEVDIIRMAYPGVNIFLPNSTKISMQKLEDVIIRLDGDLMKDVRAAYSSLKTFIEGRVIRFPQYELIYALTNNSKSRTYTI